MYFTIRCSPCHTLNILIFTPLIRTFELPPTKTNPRVNIATQPSVIFSKNITFSKKFVQSNYLTVVSFENFVVSFDHFLTFSKKIFTEGLDRLAHYRNKSQICTHKTQNPFHCNQLSKSNFHKREYGIWKFCQTLVQNRDTPCTKLSTLTTTYNPLQKHFSKLINCSIFEKMLAQQRVQTEMQHYITHIFTIKPSKKSAHNTKSKSQICTHKTQNPFHCNQLSKSNFHKREYGPWKFCQTLVQNMDTPCTKLSTLPPTSNPLQKHFSKLINCSIFENILAQQRVQTAMQHYITYIFTIKPSEKSAHNTKSTQTIILLFIIIWTTSSDVHKFFNNLQRVQTELQYYNTDPCHTIIPQPHFTKRTYISVSTYPTSHPLPRTYRSVLCTQAPNKMYRSG